MKKLPITLSLLIVLLAPGRIISQAQNDVQSWTSLKLIRDLPKNFSASAEVQMRRYNNLSMFRQWFGQLEGAFKINKYLSVALGTRYIYTPAINSIRFYNDWTGKYEFKLDGIGLDKFKLGLSARLRFQTQFSNIPEPPLTIRPKIKMELIRKKWKVIPFIGYENYFGQEYDGIERGRMRLSAGVDIDLKKSFVLSLGYIWQKPVNRAEPVNANIFSVSLEYNWKKAKKKKSPTDGE